MESVTLSVRLAAQDMGNFCSRNLGFCNAGNTVLAEAASRGKATLLSAYAGIRNQYDEPDRRTLTGSVKKSQKP